MPDHIGRGLANHPAQNSLGLAVERPHVLVDLDLDPARLERNSGGRKLGGQGRLPVAGDGLAHLTQCFATEAQHVADLVEARRSLRQEPGRELTLKRDQGEAVAQKVVEVA